MPDVRGNAASLLVVREGVVTELTRSLPRGWFSANANADAAIVVAFASREIYGVDLETGGSWLLATVPAPVGAVTWFDGHILATLSQHETQPRVVGQIALPAGTFHPIAPAAWRTGDADELVADTSGAFALGVDRVVSIDRAGATREVAHEEHIGDLALTPTHAYWLRWRPDDQIEVRRVARAGGDAITVTTVPLDANASAAWGDRFVYTVGDTLFAVGVDGHPQEIATNVGKPIAALAGDADELHWAAPVDGGWSIRRLPAAHR